MDKIDTSFENYENICNGKKKGFVNQTDTSLIHKGHRAHGFYAGCRSRDPEIDQLKKELTEINNIIFTNSILLGSDKYFEIRRLCTRHMRDGI